MPPAKLTQPLTKERPGAKHHKMLIDGEWVASSTGEETAVHSPVTGEIIGYVPVPSPQDVDRAVKSSRAAFEKFRQWGPFDRAQLTHRIAQSIDKRIEELARMSTLESGKPYTAEAIGCVTESAENFRIAAEDVKRQESPIIPARDPNKRIYTFYRPYGVWVCITPWNFPTLIPSELLGPGIASGNTIIFKPSEYTPITGLLFSEIIQDADLPPGVLNCLPGAGPTVGDQLITHPGVDAIGFIGSDRTGLMISQRAGLKHKLLEMGGNGPTIILDDANLEKAAELTAFGCFYDSGQVCCATERILVSQRVYPEFKERMVDQARKIVLGDPFDPATTMGPLCNEMTAAKMDRHLADAVKLGGKVLFGGKRATGFPTNLYYEPTVIADVPEGALIHSEESFGPLAAMLQVDSDDELIRIANSGKYGLQMGLFTSSLKRTMYFADRLKTGNLVVNDSTDYWEPHVPFGGGGGTVSGHGRIGGKYTLQNMVYLNTIVIDYANTR